MATDLKKKVDEKQLILPAPETEVRSALLLKKITGVCVSTIAYLRNLFDEDDFCLRSFNGISIRVLKGASKNSHGVQCLSKWLEGAFDAINNKYLKMLIFDIKDTEGRLLETYSFEYSYTNSKVQVATHQDTTLVENIMTQETGTEVTGATRMDIQALLRNILVATSTQKPLPPNCTTSVRITYYDDTPEDYEPPGFKPFVGDSTDFVGTPMKWTCGKVSTSFHTLTVKAKQIQQIETSSSEIEFGGVVCPCELKDNAGCLLKCESCGSLQHHPCFKIFSSDGNSQSQSDELHKCMKCSGFNSSDGFDSVECVFRRVLFLCTKNKSLSIRKLTLELGLSPESAILNIRRLQREGALQKSVQPVSIDKLEFMYNVNKTTLINILKPKYFNK